MVIKPVIKPVGGVRARRHNGISGPKWGTANNFWWTTSYGSQNVLYMKLGTTNIFIVKFHFYFICASSGIFYILQMYFIYEQYSAKYVTKCQQNVTIRGIYVFTRIFYNTNISIYSNNIFMKLQ